MGGKYLLVGTVPLYKLTFFVIMDNDIVQGIYTFCVQYDDESFEVVVE